MVDVIPEIKKDEEKVVMASKESDEVKKDGEEAETKPETKPEADSPKPTKKEEAKETEEEAERRKKKYANWPMRDIKEPHENDVLYGRGGGTNHHPGNKIYRKTVEDKKLDYVNSKRLDKPLVALEIIRDWRAQSPPGRFLKLDEKTGLWHDVGDKKAREKTSQALREKAPEIRKKQEEEATLKEGKDPQKENNKEKDVKETRFAEGTKEHQRDKVKHAILARDHSLGREYLGSGETVSLDGFTWDPASLDRIPSYGSTGPYPPGRVTSYGSEGAVPPHFPPSRVGSYSSGSGGPPMPMPTRGDYYRNMSQEQRQQSFGSGRYDSWSRLPSGDSVPPPPMPYPGNPYGHYGSGSFSSLTGMPISREHSLANNPLRDASVSHPITQGFDGGRSGSGYWGGPNMPPPPPPPPHAHRMSSPPHPHRMPPAAYGGPRYMSGEPPPHSQHAPSGLYEQSHPPAPSHRSRPAVAPPGGRKYEIDPVIAKSWSTQSEDYEIAATVFGGQELHRSWSGGSDGEPERQKARRGTFSDQRDLAGPAARPDMVKRMTSNQNEDFDTKPDYMGDGRSIKRAALNRDNSMASNRLKEEYAPGALKKPPVLEKEMRSLSISMEQSSLDARPKHLASDERTSTIDMITMELMEKPNPLNLTSRSTTIDELGFSLDMTESELSPEEPSLPKPPRLRTEGRLSTAEYLDIVNEPLGDDEPEQRPLNLNREASVSEWLSLE